MQKVETIKLGRVQLTENLVNNISCFEEIVTVSRLLKMQ